MHQYLDSDGSGTSDICVSSDIGAQRLADATAWLQQYNLKGFLGEIGAGSNGASSFLPICILATRGEMLMGMCDLLYSGLHRSRLRRALLDAAGRRRLGRRALVGCRTVVGRLLSEHRAAQWAGGRFDPSPGVGAFLVRSSVEGV